MCVLFYLVLFCLAFLCLGDISVGVEVCEFFLYWIIIVVNLFHIKFALSYIYHKCGTVRDGIWCSILYVFFPPPDPSTWYWKWKKKIKIKKKIKKSVYVPLCFGFFILKYWLGGVENKSKEIKYKVWFFE